MKGKSKGKVLLHKIGNSSQDFIQFLSMECCQERFRDDEKRGVIEGVKWENQRWKWNLQPVG